VIVILLTNHFYKIFKFLNKYEEDCGRKLFNKLFETDNAKSNFDLKIYRCYFLCW